MKEHISETCKNRQVRSSGLSYKALGEWTPGMEGLLKDGVCINNALQNNRDAVFIAAISKATHDHKVILNHQTKMRISTEALKKLKSKPCSTITNNDRRPYRNRWHCNLRHNKFLWPITKV
jgi:hypothetical protein